MWKLLEINGFRTSSSSYACVEKYVDDNSKYYFVLKFTDFFDRSTIYVFKDNINDISKFNNILRNNGSLIFYNFNTSKYCLVGKKLLEIKKDATLHILDIYDIHPYDIPVNTDLYSNYVTELSLLEIFKIEWNDDFTIPYWSDLLVA